MNLGYSSFTPSATFSIQGKVRQTVYNISDFNAKIDGSTDDTTAVNAAIATAMTNGGSVFVPPGSGPCLCLGALDFPYTGSGTDTPTQKPLRIFGVGPSWNGYWAQHPINGGSILDLRYAGGDGFHVAKIDTRGGGFLELDHLTITSGGSDNYQIMQTTNTTVFIHHNAIIGNQANYGQNCLQDFIRLGGTTTTPGDNSNGQFQGYGSLLSNNYYSHIRRGSSFGCYVNGIMVQNETFSSYCGSGETHGAPYVFDPGSGASNETAGVQILGGTIEMVSYPYAVALIEKSTNHYFNGITTYDNGAAFIAQFYCGSGCVNNFINPGYGALPLLAGPAASGQIVYGSKIILPTGADGSVGSGTLSGGTATISTTAVTSNSLIFLTDTSNGANIGTLSVGSITSGTSFIINSSNVLDSSTFNWFMVN
jgi:hypothetical protein